MRHANVSAKITLHKKKYFSGNPSACIRGNETYLNIIVDTSIIVCDEIINATDRASTNVTNVTPANIRNTISTNITSTLSINSDDKKLRSKMDCYNLHTVLLVVILLFIIIIIWCHGAKYRSKQRRISTVIT